MTPEGLPLPNASEIGALAEKAAPFMYAAIGIFLGKMSLKSRAKNVPEYHRGLRTYGDAARRKRRPITRPWIPAGALYTGIAGKDVIKPGPKLNMFMHDIAVVSIADRSLNMKDMTITDRQSGKPVTVEKMAERDTEKNDKVLQTLARLSIICHVADEEDNASNPFGVAVPYYDLIYNSIYGAQNLNDITVITVGNTLRKILLQSDNPQNVSDIELLEGVNATDSGCGRELYEKYGMLISKVPIQDIAESGDSMDMRGKVQAATIVANSLRSSGLHLVSPIDLNETHWSPYDFESQTSKGMQQIRETSEQASRALGVERQY